MFFKLSFIGFLILQSVVTSAGQVSQYTMADLEALESEKNVEEFFKHAKGHSSLAAPGSLEKNDPFYGGGICQRTGEL